MRGHLSLVKKALKGGRIRSRVSCVEVQAGCCMNWIGALQKAALLIAAVLGSNFRRHGLGCHCLSTLEDGKRFRRLVASVWPPPKYTGCRLHHVPLIPLSQNSSGTGDWRRPLSSEARTPARMMSST